MRGYTRFTLEQGDEAAATLATRFAAVADAVVRSYDGRVAELRGDEALAVFTSPRRALRAAVELQDRLTTATEGPIAAGIGLDAGEAIPVGDGFRGAALNLAARLCSLAGPGEILASDTIANLARKLDGLEYADRGAVQLKGFAEPVNVVRVQPSASPSAPADAGEARPPADDGAVSGDLPIGGYLGSLPANRLVGREAELARILALVEGVEEGRGRLIALAGEPGVGKTRLAQEVTLTIRNRGFIIAAGRCYEPQGSVPFYPFLDALADAYAAASPALRARVPGQWPDLARLLPALGLPHTDGAASADQQRLNWQVTGFLQALAAEGAMALLLDDLHWADAASLDLLLHLARHTGKDRILLLGTYRDVEVNRRHPLEAALRDLRREDLLEQIAVRRLEQGKTAALVAATMGQERVSDEFAALIFRRTEGNPFFVQQVMRMLVERGDVYHEGDHWERKAVAEIEVPESIRSVVGQRLSRLGEDTQAILRDAAVLGQTISFDALELVTGRAEEEIEHALDEAGRAGLVREIDHDRYAFDHALTQQSLYAEIPTRRRRRLHLAAGEAIERTAGHRRESRAAELAWHFLEGDDPERALRWGLAAGDGAEEVFAHSDAELQYRTALQLAHELGDQERELEALEKLGHVLFMLARYGEELDVLLPALQLYGERGDLAGEMRVAAAIGWAHFELSQRGKGIDLLQPILRQWEGTAREPSAAAAALHISLGNLYWGDGANDAALPLFERAAELAGTVGDERLLGLAESRRASTLQVMDRIDEALEAFDRAIALAEKTNDLDTLTRSLNNRSIVYGQHLHDLVRAEADMERQIEVARRLGKPAQLAFALKSIGERHRIQGDLERALQYTAEAASIARGLGAARGTDSIALEVDLRLLRGETEAAVQELEGCITAGRERQDTELLNAARYALASWALVWERPAEARRRMEEALADARLEDQARWSAEVLLTTALAYVGEIERADDLLSAGLAQARAIGIAPMLLQWQKAEGTVRACQGRWDEARDAFERARRFSQVVGTTLFEATLLHEYGRMEARAGNQEAARARFEEALTRLRPMGAVALAEQVERELARL